MNTLLGTRVNILYSKLAKKDKETPDEYKKFTEIILLCDKPNYELTNDSDVVRSRGVEQLRFVVSEKGLEALIKTLQEIKDANEDDFE